MQCGTFRSRDKRGVLPIVPTYGYGCCHALEGSVDAEGCLLASAAPGPSMPRAQVAQVCRA